MGGVKVIVPRRSEPPAVAHCSLRSRRGLGLRQVDRGPGIAPLRRRPHCVRWRPPLRWSLVLWMLLTVDRAPHRLPDLSSWTGGIVTPVISSLAPHHRLPGLAPRGPLRGPLVAGGGEISLLLHPRVSARRVEPGGTRCRSRGSR